jgi:hypothetical protein
LTRLFKILYIDLKFFFGIAQLKRGDIPLIDLARPGKQLLLMENEAIARGALESGVRVCTANTLRRSPHHSPLSYKP